MDPVTHAVSGVALAVTLESQNGRLPAHLDRTLIVAALAGMSPDIDYFQTPFGPGNEGLSYMLCHRGVVHSFVFCLLLSALIVGLVWLFSRKGAAPGRLFLIGFLCASLHVVMDGTNDYGVHPFWPIWNGWLYGDFIFLLEPLVVLSLLPLALRGILSDRGSRRANLIQLGLAVLALLGLLTLLWIRVAQGQYIGWLSTLFASGYLLGHVLLACWRRNYSPFAWGSLLLVYGVFFLASRQAKAEATQAVQAASPQARLVQVDTTPAASNPFCWGVTTAAFDASTGRIITRMGTLSLIPRQLSPCECRTATREGPPTFNPGVPLACAEGEGVAWHWLAQRETNVEDLRVLAARNCRVAEALRFLRTPALIRQTSDAQALLGDLRLDYSTDLAEYCKYRFDEQEQIEPRKCEFSTLWIRYSIPHWIPPFFDPRSGGPAMEPR
ncbi:MAG TPA: metal-dependent hydrolase [Polyangiaceae bacterium]